jgi:hypothetical protein
MPGSIVSHRDQPVKISFSGTGVKSDFTFVPEKLILLVPSSRSRFRERHAP